MRKTDDRALAFLLSISDELAGLRRDVEALQIGLMRIGALAPDADAAKLAATWEPPVLKRLGDMITIIAQSSPASAAAMKQAGDDTARDRPIDPRRDPLRNANFADNIDAGADGVDPTFKDADMTAKDWFSMDIDPVKQDGVNKRNRNRDVRDPDPPKTDDNDGIAGQVRPDTPTDSIV